MTKPHAKRSTDEFVAVVNNFKLFGKNLEHLKLTDRAQRAKEMEEKEEAKKKNWTICGRRTSC